MIDQIIPVLIYEEDSTDDDASRRELLGTTNVVVCLFGRTVLWTNSCGIDNLVVVL